MHGTPSLLIKDTLQPTHRNSIESITRNTGFFTEEEVAITLEIADEYLEKGPEKSGYHFLVVENQQGHVCGYASYGPIPMTQSSFDLYWIVVEKASQSKGVGKLLLKAIEKKIAESGGAQVFVETAGREQYLPTRIFYERNAYIKAAQLKDFYAPGDDKVIFVKSVSKAGF